MKPTRYRLWLSIMRDYLAQFLTYCHCKRLVFIAAFLLWMKPSYAQICELIVDQPPSSPSVARSDGNHVSGGGTLRITQHPAYGTWVVHLTTNLLFKPAGESSFGGVSSYTTDVSVANGSAIGTLIQGGSGFVTLDARGNGSYKTTISSTGTCNGTTVPLTPGAPTQSSELAIQRPTITANGIAGMWWLNGVADAAAHLYDEAEIVGTVNCSTCTSTLTYSIIAGSDKASLTCQFCNTTSAKARAPSPYCNAQDVAITAALDGFTAAAPVKLSVNTFRNARRTTPKPPVATTSAYNGGYLTDIFYNIEDLCTVPVTYRVSVNESFGARTPSTSQWNLPNVQPAFVIPFGDEIAVYPLQPGNIQPVIPFQQGPLGNTLIDQIAWSAQMGSQITGSGLNVMNASQMRYLDHGDHSSNP
jgi:hypothetical protein